MQLDAFGSKQHSLSRAESHIFELLHQMQSVLTIQSDIHLKDDVATWLPKYDAAYVSIINDCEFYLSLAGCKTEFLLHWLFTKYVFLGSDGLLTDDNSVLLLSAVLDEMRQNSLKNAIKTQSFWSNFALSSIVRTLRYPHKHTGQLIDSFLETFNADFLDGKWTAPTTTNVS